MSPPDRAIVPCVDEKNQIQALDRSQPMLLMRPGQAARRSHDYKRHGTTSLCAALDIATGAVIGKCYARHRAKEFRKFLDEIEAAVPSDLDVHLVMDNYATPKTPLVRNWLAKRPRWHVHLTPTSASWLDQVERVFALISDRKIKRGIHRSVSSLRADIMAYIQAHNADPKPLRWTKSADDIRAVRDPSFLQLAFWRGGVPRASCGDAIHRSSPTRCRHRCWVLRFEPSRQRGCGRC